MATEAQRRTELVDELLDRIGQTVGQKAQVSTVFGEPVERDSVTVIPVAKTRFGFGGGGGTGTKQGDEGSGGGGGGGAVISPVGYIELRNGGAEFKRISSPADVVTFVAAASIALLAIKRLID
ncbi:MAG TPA: spore germination protein GerW family protein [Gaiellaceae bacterium]